MRRRVFVISVFLLAGAVVNVAVAWGCALLLSPPRLRIDADAPALERPRFDLNLHGASLVLVGTPMSGIKVQRPPPGVPSDSAAGALIPVSLDSAVAAFFDARGWPLVCLWCEYPPPQIPPFANPVRRSAIQASLALNPARSYGSIRTSLASWSASGFYFEPSLPLRVLHGAFLLNVLFYAGSLWLLFLAPGTLRRWRRIKRGLCPACAYPIGASALCTECGKPVTPRSVEAAT